MLREEDISVVDNEAKESNKKITIYSISIYFEGQSHRTFTRYNQLQAFNQKLKKYSPSLTKELKLSTRKFFLTSDLSGFRRQAIKCYVLKLFAIPALTRTQIVRDFFNLPLISSLPSSSSSSPFISGDLDDDEAYFSEQRDSRSDSVDSTGVLEKKGAKPKDFEFLKVLGIGNFGKVLLARHKNENFFYAVKVVNKELVKAKNEARHIMAERNVLLKAIPHPFLVGLKYSFQTSAKLYFVLDYVNGGELFFHIQRTKSFSEDAGRFYGAEIASALGFLHKHDIIYRDLKPENILLDREGHVRLTDFGLSKIIVKNKPSALTFCGTPEYLAPEMIERRSYNHTVDWWCLGSVLHEIYYGLPPFYNKNISTMYKNVVSQPLKFPEKPVLSSAAKEVMHDLLQKNSAYRLGAKDDLDEIKCHKFFLPINWDLLDKKLLKPPLTPKLKDDLDLSNFDETFTKEAVPASVEYSSLEHRYNYENKSRNLKNNMFNKVEENFNPLVNFKKEYANQNKRFLMNANSNYNNNNYNKKTNMSKSNSYDDDVFQGFSYAG